MTLHLLPNLLGESASPDFNFIKALPEIVNNLDGFLVEHPKEARKYLKHFDFAKLRDKPMEILDKRTRDFNLLLEPIKRGESWGVITDAGLPCIADPGSDLVSHAQKAKINVMAYPGPSSIILALMLSGLNSQQFVFQGYFPRQIDRTIRNENRTQVFIETPYNNQKTLSKLLEVLDKKDILCVACDLTLSTQEVITQSMSKWHSVMQQNNFHKRPAIFLLKITL